MFQLFHRQQSKSNDKSFVIVDRDGRIKMEIDTAELFGEKCRANAGDNEDEVKQNAENEEKEFALNFDDEEDEADHKFCYGLQYSSQGQLELSGIDADTESIDQQCLEDKPNSSISAKGFSKFERRWFSVNDMASGAYQKKLLELVMSSSSGDWNMVGQKECWLTPFYRFFGRLSNAKTTETTLDIPLEKLVEPRKIGCGGQGDVYVAKFRGEEVAMKKMRHSYSTEALYLQRLQHTNIVQFFGLAGKDYLVMEYCRLGSLDTHLASLRKTSSECLSPTQFVNWAEQISSGMAYLHRHGVIHRDLKSSNVLIADKYRLKISDFGISRQMNAQQSEDKEKMNFAGTIGWMAPEVMRSEPYTEKVDVWSYGVVLWELITLEQPYRGMAGEVIIYKVGNYKDLLPISKLPRTVRKLLRLCFSRRSCDRPSFEDIKTILRCHVNPELGTIDPKRYIDLQKQWRFVISQELDKIAGLTGKAAFDKNGVPEMNLYLPCR